MEQYGQQILKYVTSLPKSSVKVVFFDRTEKPFLLEQLSIMSIPSGEYYINSGPKGLWSYIYKMADIRYLIVRQKTHVTAFLGKEYSDIEGGSRFDHLTVALKKVKAEMLLSSHMTTYEETSNFVFNIEHSPNYNIIFKTDFNETEPLVPNKYVQNKTLVTAYENDKHWIEILRTIHKVYQGCPMHQSGGASHYEVHVGKKGGKYLKDNNGKKRYLKQKGGSLVTNDIIRFIYENVIKAVLNFYAGDLSYVEAKLFFDEIYSDDFVICYDMPEVGHRRLYYLDIQKTVDAYDDCEACKTDKTKNKLPILDFFQSLSKMHIEEMGVV